MSVDKEWVCSKCLVRPVCNQACPEHWAQLDDSIEITAVGDPRRRYLWNDIEVEGVLLCYVPSVSAWVKGVSR